MNEPTITQGTAARPRRHVPSLMIWAALPVCRSRPIRVGRISCRRTLLNGFCTLDRYRTLVESVDRAVHSPYVYSGHHRRYMCSWDREIHQASCVLPTFELEPAFAMMSEPEPEVTPVR